MTPPRGSILLEVCVTRLVSVYHRSPASQTLRVIRLSLGPAWSWNPVRTYKNCKKEEFWNSAKPSTYGDSVPSSITWDDQFVGEVARTVKACQVFLFMPFWWLCMCPDSKPSLMAPLTLNDPTFLRKCNSSRGHERLAPLAGVVVFGSVLSPQQPGGNRPPDIEHLQTRINTSPRS
jgi:hypothetical protein